jgi:hypothetical protein
MSFRGDVGSYAADVHVAYVRADWLGGTVAAGWLVVPVAVQTVFNPGDAIWAQDILQGLPVPATFTAQQLAAGFIEAVIALVVLAGFQLAGTILFYRRTQLQLEVGGSVATPALWPLAVTAGILGNCAWFIGTQAFDPFGFLVGLTSAALTVGGELLCEWLGREFVFGPALAGPHQW